MGGDGKMELYLLCVRLNNHSNQVVKGGRKLVSTAQTKKIWSATSIIDKGMTPSKIWKSFILSIHLST